MTQLLNLYEEVDVAYEALPHKGTFGTAFERLIGHEGKFQNKRSDRGNWTSGTVGVGELKGTKYGISAMSYPSVDIENLTQHQALVIYRRDFWDANKLDQMPFPLAFQMFDMIVNHGRSNAVKMLQRAVGAGVDGRIGPETLTALGMQSYRDTLDNLIAERIEFFTNISTFDDYGKGWMRRVAGQLRYIARDTSS